MATKFFDQEKPELTSDERQTNAVLGDVKANHAQFVRQEAVRQSTPEGTPKNPSWLRRNVGNIAACGAGVAILGVLVVLGAEAAADQGDRVKEESNQMYEQQQQDQQDADQPIRFGLEP